MKTFFNLVFTLLALSLFVTVSQASDDNALSAAEAEDGGPKSKRSAWNEVEGKFLTYRLGGGFLWDLANYDQDKESKQQMDLAPASQLRDFRILLKGRFKNSPRLTYSLGYMYDAAQEDWRFRQTGIMVDVPEWNGNFFIGRTKEGFSTNKIMVGYHGWTNERAAANDAFIPILADGIKWMGRTNSNRFVYNIGYFNEKITPEESYDKNDEIVAARAVWLPLSTTNSGELLHLALEGRYGSSKNGFLQYKSKPESFPAQDFAVDSGKIKATGSTMGGIEVYYRPGPFMFGMEYFFNQVASSSAKNPFFHGGEMHVSYLLTGETRPYNEKGGYFQAVSPAHSFFKGGKGAWEAVLRTSYVDMDSQGIDGGKFWRITPMMNWHLNDNARLEFVYGYSVLERFNVTGHTQYAQARLQLSFN